MSAYKQIEIIEDKIKVGESTPIANLINLYSTGLISKMKNAEYALSKLNEFCTQIDSLTSTSPFTVLDKVHFHLDSFFAFLYSSFDVVAQVINQKSKLNIDENKVAFRRLKTILNQNHPGIPIQILINRISNSNFFKLLEKYRHCSTHRRQICIQSQKTEISLTRGYSATIPMTKVSHMLCDDPLTINPKFTKKREIITYCENCFKRTQKEVIQILKKL
jgi:hypothetical protein